MLGSGNLKVSRNELTLLSNIAQVLTASNTSSAIVKGLSNTLRKFASLDTFSIYIYDKNTDSFKDYSKSWFSMEDPGAELRYSNLHKVFGLMKENYDFFINLKPFKMDQFAKISPRIFNDGQNVILFPLMKGDRPFGVLELNFYSNISQIFNYDFFSALYIAAYQVSLKIQNTILAQQMQKHIDFHESMKNIAKIIETQYELNYIIPLIGEMIDKFIVEHLIYIFLYNEEAKRFNLVWPLACREERVMSILNTINNESHTMITDDGRLGFFPMIGENNLLGCIVANSIEEKLNGKEIEYLEQLSQQSSITIHRANVYAEVLQHATLDALTGLNNRRQFEVRLSQEVASAKRQEKALCAMMIDVDFFKKVNDTYGHIVGDCILKNVAEVIKNTVRETDIPARYGGEEFAILLPFTQIKEAGLVAQRLRKAVELSKVDITEHYNGDEKEIGVTISVGIYQFKSTDSAETLYSNADKALYSAKESGRNKVMMLK